MTIVIVISRNLGNFFFGVSCHWIKATSILTNVNEKQHFGKVAKRDVLDKTCCTPWHWCRLDCSNNAHCYGYKPWLSGQCMRGLHVSLRESGLGLGWVRAPTYHKYYPICLTRTDNSTHVDQKPQLKRRRLVLVSCQAQQCYRNANTTVKDKKTLLYSVSGNVWGVLLRIKTDKVLSVAL